MGQYEDRRNGHHFYQFTHDGKDYKHSGYLTKRAAYNAEHARRVELARDAAKPIEVRPSITVEGYFELWMSEHVKIHLRPRTADLYRHVFERHIQPRLGRVTIQDLRRAQVKAMVSELEHMNLARGTIKNVIIPLCAMLNAAKDDGLIENNPADAIKQKSRARSVEEGAKVSVYTQTELDMILAHIDETKPRYGLLLRTLAHSGLRLSEGSGLRPGDIESDYLWVRRGVQYAQGRLDIYAPKSGKSRRVDLPVETARRLRDLPKGDWCFPHMRDLEMPAHPDHVRGDWRTLCEGLGATQRRVHDLRHTYACLLIQAGAPLVYVKEQLGHSSIQLTADTYGHLIPGENRKWVDQAFPGGYHAH